jgi:hypothetical protein
MYLLTKAFIATCLLGGATLLSAQAIPTASRVGDLQIGVGYSNANSDYLPMRFNGATGYADFDISSHLGVEAEFRYLHAPTPSAVYEKTYQVGGRYFRTYHRWVPYAKAMYGRGVFNFPYYPIDNTAAPNVPTANLAYNMFVGGGGADFKLKPYLNLRADFEYQHWMSFPPNGLTPTVLTLGAAYHFK